jgi:hypothetical protein
MAAKQVVAADFAPMRSAKRLNFTVGQPEGDDLPP